MFADVMEIRLLHAILLNQLNSDHFQNDDQFFDNIQTGFFKIRNTYFLYINYH